MTAAMTALRLSFIVLFGAMSLLHGPVMTFSGAHASTPAAHQQAGHPDHDSHHAAPDCHDHHAPAAGHVPCNAFACFMAIEPMSAMVRPLHAVLFAIMAAAPMSALDPARTAPALPPPRFQG